jgi:hypothetical protein
LLGGSHYFHVGQRRVVQFVRLFLFDFLNGISNLHIPPVHPRLGYGIVEGNDIFLPEKGPKRGPIISDFLIPGGKWVSEENGKWLGMFSPVVGWKVGSAREAFTTETQRAAEKQPEKMDRKQRFLL